MFERSETKENPVSNSSGSTMSITKTLKKKIGKVLIHKNERFSVLDGKKTTNTDPETTIRAQRIISILVRLSGCKEPVNTSDYKLQQRLIREMLTYFTKEDVLPAELLKLIVRYHQDERSNKYDCMTKEEMDSLNVFLKTWKETNKEEEETDMFQSEMLLENQTFIESDEILETEEKENRKRKREEKDSLSDLISKSPKKQEQTLDNTYFNLLTGKIEKSSENSNSISANEVLRIISSVIKSNVSHLLCEQNFKPILLNKIQDDNEALPPELLKIVNRHRIKKNGPQPKILFKNIKSLFVEWDGHLTQDTEEKPVSLDNLNFNLENGKTTMAIPGVTIHSKTLLKILLVVAGYNVKVTSTALEVAQQNMRAMLRHFSQENLALPPGILKLARKYHKDGSNDKFNSVLKQETDELNAFLKKWNALPIGGMQSMSFLAKTDNIAVSHEVIEQVDLSQYGIPLGEENSEMIQRFFPK